MIDHFSFITDQHSRVPEAAKARCWPLVETDVRPDVVLRTCLLQRTDLRTIDMQALRSEAMEKRVVVYGS